MAVSENMTSALVDALYDESIELVSDTRAYFAYNDAPDLVKDGDPVFCKVKPSYAAFKVATQLAHAIALLTVRKAHLAGKVKENKMAIDDRIIDELSKTDPEYMASLDKRSRQMMQASEDLFKRVILVERSFQNAAEASEDADATVSPVLAMQDYLRGAIKA